MNRTPPRRATALLATTLLLAGLATMGPAASPAAAACAAPTQSVGGVFTGEDGRQIGGLVGIVLLDAGGGYIGMDGCPMAPGYASHVFINLGQFGAFTLGTDGAASGYQARWQIDGIPSNARTTWVEGYPKSNTPDTTGYYGDHTDYRRYGGAMRRGVPISTNIDLRLPLNCGIGAGDNGAIDATVTLNGGPANVDSAWAFSLAPENAGQTLGFVTSEETGSGRFTIRALEPNQNYALQINLVGGGSYWFENYGPGVPVEPCSTTTRSFVLNPSSGQAIATGGGIIRPAGVGVVDVAGVRSVFTRANDGSVQQQVDQAGSSPFSLGGQILGEPDATSWGAGVADVVVRGADGTVYYRRYRNGSWGGGWTSLGGGTGYSPSIVSWGPNRLDVVITGLDGQVWHRWSGNGGDTWSGWSPQGGRLTSAPDVAAWGVNRLDIVGRGGDGQLWHRAWSGASWLAWQGLGGQLLGGPAAVGPAANRLEIAVVGTDRIIYSLRWDGGRWTGFANTGGGAVSDPDAATYGGSASIYVRGTDGAIYRTTRSSPSSGLNGWSRL